MQNIGTWKISDVATVTGITTSLISDSYKKLNRLATFNITSISLDTYKNCNWVFKYTFRCASFNGYRIRNILADSASCVNLECNAMTIRFLPSSDMIRRRNLRTRSIKMLVLDEADEMLNKGAFDDDSDMGRRNKDIRDFL